MGKTHCLSPHWSNLVGEKHIDRVLPKQPAHASEEKLRLSYGESRALRVPHAGDDRGQELIGCRKEACCGRVGQECSGIPCHSHPRDAERAMASLLHIPRISGPVELSLDSSQMKFVFVLVTFLMSGSKHLTRSNLRGFIWLEV